MALPAVLPRRDPAARAHLSGLGRHAAPTTIARDRAVALTGGLGALVPGGAVVRGSVLQVTGPAGAGTTSLAFAIAAAFTSAGEWAAAVDDGAHGVLGGL